MLRVLSFIIFFFLAFTGVDVLTVTAGNTLPFVGGYISPYITNFLPEALATTTALGKIIFTTIFMTCLALVALSLTGVTRGMRLLYSLVAAITSFVYIFTSFGVLNGFIESYPAFGEFSSVTAPFLTVSFILALVLAWPFEVPKASASKKPSTTETDADDVENIDDVDYQNHDQSKD